MLPWREYVMKGSETSGRRSLEALKGSGSTCLWGAPSDISLLRRWRRGGPGTCSRLRKLVLEYSKALLCSTQSQFTKDSNIFCLEDRTHACPYQLMVLRGNALVQNGGWWSLPAQQDVESWGLRGRTVLGGEGQKEEGITSLLIFTTVILLNSLNCTFLENKEHAFFIHEIPALSQNTRHS